MRRHEPPFRLREVKLEVTHQCALTCLHCSSEANWSCRREMDPDKASYVLDEMMGLGVTDIAFSGGEPILWRGLYDAVRQCAEKGVETTIYTSGNVDNSSLAMSLLANSGACRVVFSVFGADRDVHERITRVSGSLERTLSAMDAAREAGLSVELHFVPMRSNFRELLRIADLARGRQVARVSVLRFAPQGRGAIEPGMALTHDENLELRRMMVRAREKIDLRAGSPYNFLLVNDSPECCAAIDRLIVGPDFRIYPCDAFKQVESGELVGADDFSQLDRWSLQECWEKSPYLGAVRSYLTTAFGPPCDACELLERCLSGCLAQKVIANGTLDKAPDPMCLKLGMQ